MRGTHELSLGAWRSWLLLAETGAFFFFFSFFWPQSVNLLIVVQATVTATVTACHQCTSALQETSWLISFNLHPSPESFCLRSWGNEADKF